MNDLKVLQQALDNRPNPWMHEDSEIEEWFEDFARKFAAYRASLEVPIGKKELSLRKRAEVWWIACQASRKGPHGCFVTNHHEEWKCKDCQDLLTKLFQELNEYKETCAVLSDEKLMKAIRKGRKKGSKSSPYKPLLLELLPEKLMVDRKQLSEERDKLSKEIGDYISEPLPEQFEYWKHHQLGRYSLIKELLGK